MKVGTDILGHILSFVLDPMAMTPVCAVSHRLSGTAWTRDAWAGSVIDTSKIRPLGSMAHSHFTLWISAELIIGGAWQQMSVSLLMSTSFATWSWLQQDGRPFLSSSGRWMLASQSTVPARIMMQLDLDALLGGIVIGITNSRAFPDVVEGRMEHARSVRFRPPGDLRCPIEFCCTGDTARLDGDVQEVTGSVDRLQYMYAIIMFEQNEKPEGHILPCWTKCIHAGSSIALW